MQKAVLIDKDGTLINNIPYSIDVNLIKFTSNALAGLKLMQNMGYLIIIVTNQSGIAYGLFGEEEIKAVKDRIKAKLTEHGIKLSGFYYCPHHPEGKVSRYAIKCNCRKPQSGLLLKASSEHSLDLKNSWLIGDVLNDIEAGNRVGCRSILLNKGSETEWYLNKIRKPEIIVSDLLEAAKYIDDCSITLGAKYE
jgi:D,D-heptose 1,7-bisphosphate phosphatase